MYVYGCISSEADPGCLPPLLSTLFINAGLLGEPRVHRLPGLASQLALRTPCLCVLSVGITGSHFTWSTFTWALGIPTLAAMLAMLAFKHRDISYSYVRILLWLGVQVSGQALF